MGKSKGDKAAAADVKPSKPKAKNGEGSNLALYMGFACAVAVLAVGLQAAGVLPHISWSLPAPPVPETSTPRTSTTRSSTAKMEVTSDPKKDAAAKMRRQMEMPQKAPPRNQMGPIDPGCVDDNESCESWAKTGECDRNEPFMTKTCRASCHVCNGGKPPPKKLLTPCQWLRHPDGECGHAALQKYLAACRVQLEDQVNVDLRYRFEHRAQCNAQGRTVVGHYILNHDAPI